MTIIIIIIMTCRYGEFMIQIAEAPNCRQMHESTRKSDDGTDRIFGDKDFI